MKKRLLSVVLVLCMMLNLLPMRALAADSTALSEPKVTQLTVSYDGGDPVELLEGQPVVSMPTGSKPVFTVSFNNTELLNQVFVASTKDGETKYLEATLQSGQYVTDGYFDSNNTNYIPGTITVTYSKKAVLVDESANSSGADLDTLKTQLSAQGTSIRNETTDADGTVSAQVVLGDAFGAMAGKYFDATISEFNAGVGIDQTELNKWLGVYQNLSELSSYDLEGAGGKQYTLYLSDKDFGDTDTYLVMVKDVTSNKYTKMLLSKAAEGIGLGDISDAMSAVNNACGKLLEYRAISKDTAALREEIATHPTMTQEQKAEANEKITALDRDKKLFMMGMMAISLMTAPVGGAPLMITAIMAGYSTMADYFWDNRVGMIMGCEPVEGCFSENDEHGGGWIPLTQAYLKENHWCISQSGKYYLVEDISLITLSTVYNESQVPIDVTICLHGHDIEFGISAGSSDGSVHSWILGDCKYVERADGTASGGRIIGSAGSSISNNSKGKLRIDNCIVEGDVYNSGTMTIAGGTFTGGGGNVYSISNLSGTMNITGGTIINSKPYAGSISNGGSMIGAGGGVATLNISGGTILNTADRCCCIDNYSDGTVNITGGTIRSIGSNVNRCIENSGTVIIDNGLLENSGASNRDGVISNAESGTLRITGGNLKASGVSGFGISNQGQVLVNGGTISAMGIGIGNSGKLEMKKGIVESQTVNAIGNSGEMSLSGGTTKSSGGFGFGLTNYDTGILSISGGIIQGESGALSTNTDGDGSVTISHGTFLGRIYNPSGLVKLWFDETSRIEITTSFNAVVSSDVTVEAAPGYDGSIMYYSEAEGVGTPMTLTQVAEVLATAPDNYQTYVRFVASGAIDEPDPGPGSDEPDCQHTYTAVVTAPTCTERGYTTHTCSKCGDSYQDNYTSVLGHSYGEWVVIKEATSTTSGTRERTCSVCQHKETSTIPATGGSSGGTTGDGSSGSVSAGGNSSTSPSAIPPVTTNTTSQGGTQTTETTAAPTVTATGGQAIITLNSTTGNEIVKQAGKNKSDSVVIAPEIKGDVSKTVVSIPASTIGQIGRKTDADLTISTPVADVKISNGGLGNLAVAGGTVAIASEKTGSTVELSVVAGGKTVNNIPEGLVLTVPVSNITSSTVAMLIREDGVREVVRKSVADRDSIIIPLNGSAKLEIVDNSKQFSDVPPDNWAAGAIAFVSSHELVNGIGNGQFSPDLPMSRGMLAVVLHNLESNPVQAITDTFSDVSGDSWHAEGIAWAAAQGIVGGYGNGMFGPNDNITREQLAVMLWRYAGSPAATDKELHFTDADKTSGYALEALRWAVENGIINGYGSGQLAPQGLATRAQVAQMLKNYLER